MDFLPAAPPGFTPLLVFGLLLIIGSLGGWLAHRLSWLPSITGFMAVGLLAGPGGLGLISPAAMQQSQILVDIALALILYRLGLSLDMKLLKQQPGLIAMAMVESIATFAAVFTVLRLFDLPGALAALVAAITVSSSPAVLLHVAHEVGARGPVTESSKTLVALNNLMAFLAFSAVLPILHFQSQADWMTIVFQPLFRLLGSLVLGILVGLALHRLSEITRQATQYRLALVIGSVMVSIGLADQLQLSMLFVPLVIGACVRTLEKEAQLSDLAFGPAFELFFIILFVFAGARLHLHELLEYAPAVLALVGARCLAKLASTLLVSSALRGSWRSGLSTGLLLWPMAGMAIGLAQASGNLFPQHATLLSAIVLGAVTVFETIGPPLAIAAFRLAGEAGATGPEQADAATDSGPVRG